MEEIVRQLWSSAPDLWNRTVVGFLIFVTFVLLRGILCRLVMRVVRRLTGKMRTEPGEKLARVMESPLRFLFPVVGLFFFRQMLDLPDATEMLADNFLRSLFLAGIFWFVYGVVDLLVGLAAWTTRSKISAEIDQWVCRSLRILVVLVGGSTVLGIWGIDIAPILAGLGIGGVAVALGAQDLFKNLIGGVAILLERRFSIGDWIKVDGVVEGTVERIGYRSTLVRQFDQAPVHLPNKQLSDSAVVNYSAMLHRRIYWKVNLSYSSSVAQLQQVRDGIETYILENEAFESPAKISTFVRVDSFSSSSIDILIYCFTKTKVWGEWLAIKEAFLYHIKEIVEQAGTSFAFPSRSLYVESLPHGTPAAFAQPPEHQLAAPDRHEGVR